MYRSTLFLTSLLLSTSTAVLVDYQSNFTAAACSCANTNDTGATTGSAYICRDPRLGPTQLPTVFPLLSFVSNYDRFGGLQPGEFLARWTDNATGNYRYPPQNGFQLDLGGRPILGNMSLLPGMQVDRFGSEYAQTSLAKTYQSFPESGSFISAADAPYAQRALPPASLDTSPTAPEYPYSYHVYTVRKRLDVL
ncbi:MAG: hypothetical protein LQ349_009709, partial [Xanthoria aureola]